MVRARGGRRGRARRTIRRRPMRNIRKALSGVAFTPRADPPRWTVAPWNSITLVIPDSVSSGARSKTYSASIISDTLCRAAGLLTASNAYIPIAMRFRAARVYIRDSIVDPLFVQFHSIIGEDDLAVVEDIPSQIQRARVGYRWPKSFTDAAVKKGSGNDDQIMTVTTAANTNYVIYLDMLWRADGIDIIKSKMDVFLQDDFDVLE